MPRIVKTKSPVKPEPYELPFAAHWGGSSATAGKGGYNKRLIVTLIIQSTTPDWMAVAQHLNKSKSQTFDMWRKIIMPNLLAGETWAGGSGSSWDRSQKITLLLKVLETAKPAWEDMLVHFPGKSKSQLVDVWRKIILPRLKRGDTIE